METLWIRRQRKKSSRVFAQDSWQVHPRLTLDLGLRLDHDSLSAEPANVAPRIGFVFAPTHDGRTALRGGFGVFFDKIPLNVAIFKRFPAQTITNYAANGGSTCDEWPDDVHAHVLPVRCTCLTALAGRCSSIANCAAICWFASATKTAVCFGTFIVNPLQSTDGSAAVALA